MSFPRTWNCRKGLQGIVSSNMDNIISPTVQMGKRRYRGAKNLLKVTQPMRDRAGIQMSARVFALHLWILGRAWHFTRWLLDSVLPVMKRPVKDAPQSWLLNFSHCARRGRHGQRPLESTQAQTERHAGLGLCSRMRASWTMTDG